MNDPSDKAAARHAARARRSGHVATLAQVQDAATLFIRHIQPAPSQIVALYWPKDDEFDTRPLLRLLQAAGVVTALPVIRPDSRVLDFVAWDGVSPLTIGLHGISQPTASALVQPDILVIPLLAFDDSGTRLGYGGGYYDATLAALRARRSIVAIGIGYDAQRSAIPLPVESHDMRLDVVVTPGLAYRFPMR